MKNAFEILGATPVHTGEELKELLEEQQLLSDDEKELVEAYASLTNPKKRIRHEIEYIAKEYFEAFNELFVDNSDSEQRMSVSDICTAIIGLGDWLDNEADYIIDEINEIRDISGFSSIDDDSIVTTAINELRASCVNAVTRYFNYIDEGGLITIFNALVKRDNFQSFFVDELLAHYGIKILDTMQTRQDTCEICFNEIERLCNSFINGGALSSLIDGKIIEFKKLLTAWDKIAQPLQVNAQRRGAVHGDSSDFVRDIRNKVIDLCNNSQESLNTLISALQFSYTAKTQLSQKLADSKTFTEYILKLLDILLGVFAEVEVTAEQLKKDKKDITDLKKTLSELLVKVDPYGRGTRSRKYDSDDYGGKVMNWVLGILIIGSFIMMMTTFDNGMVWGGILSLIITGVSIVIGILIIIGNTKPKTIKIIVVIMLGVFLLTMISAIAVGNTPSHREANLQGRTYTVTLDAGDGWIYEMENGSKTGKPNRTVTVKYGSSMPSAIIPERIGFDFAGYYTSTNGVGTMYYNASMGSVQNWDKGSNTTLYAHWTKRNKETLTSSNFSTYFTLTASVTSGYSFVLNYTIQKKSNVVVDNIWSADTLSVTIYCKVGEGNTFTVTLNKLDNYYLTGSRALKASQSSYYYMNPVANITAASGQIYVT